MKENKNIIILSDDFGALSLDKIRRDFPDRFINVGIAEQNLINLATGLALEGYIVYAYAIVSFLTMRAYEQIRLNLAISSQIKPVNINLVGVGTGLSYDVSGPTHHCLEDISIMMVLPNISILSPSDWRLTEKLVDYSVEKKEAKYFRLEGKPLPLIYSEISDKDLENGFSELSVGEKICLVSTGFMTHKALKVIQSVERIGLIDVFRLKPIDENLLESVLSKYKYIISLEEAFINKGGLDMLIARAVSKRKEIGLRNLGFSDKYVFDLGSRDYLHKINHIDEQSIIKLIKSLE